MKIAFFGAGTWGFSLANILAQNGHEVILWARNEKLVSALASSKTHPKLQNSVLHGNVQVTHKIEDLASPEIDIYCESVTSSGLRSIFSFLVENRVEPKPIVLTSKGIEHQSGKLPSEVALQALGEHWQDCICCLSGPSHAEEVTQNLPTSVVCSAYNVKQLPLIQKLFNTPLFRVYPNADIRGVEFGGAMKNIIAIACGISDGLGFGDNTKALLMTRGLHEICKLAPYKGCDVKTLSGLSGMGDLCATCLSTHSRNYNYGRKLAAGLSPEEAREAVGMVVEGAYTTTSAFELGQKHSIPLPITETIYSILHQGLSPKEAVSLLMQREVKEEHL